MNTQTDLLGPLTNFFQKLEEFMKFLELFVRITENRSIQVITEDRKNYKDNAKPELPSTTSVDKNTGCLGGFLCFLTVN